MRREDKELSKYSKYKARVDLTKIRQVASVLALLARSLGLCWGGLYSLASARVCLCWLCVHFRTARVASCHGRDIRHECHNTINALSATKDTNSDIWHYQFFLM